MEKGWIKLNRQITEHWLWLKYPFSWAQAWIDLLLLANYEDKKTVCNGQIVICKRGDVNLSFSALAKRWKWHRTTVRRFLDTLASDEMVTINATTKRTTITIVNYDNFQLRGTTDATTDVTDNVTNSAQVMRQIAHTTNKDKNDKNVKNKESRNFVPPTLNEVKEFCESRNNGIDAQHFIDFYESKGWMIGRNKMKNWQAAVRTWERRNKERGNADGEIQETEWNPETWNPFE